MDCFLSNQAWKEIFCSVRTRILQETQEKKDSKRGRGRLKVEVSSSSQMGAQERKGGDCVVPLCFVEKHFWGGRGGPGPGSTSKDANSGVMTGGKKGRKNDGTHLRLDRMILTRDGRQRKSFYPGLCWGAWSEAPERTSTRGERINIVFRRGGKRTLEDVGSPPPKKEENLWTDF